MSAPIKWDVACRIVDVLVSKYSHMLPPTIAIELRSSINNMDAEAFVKKLYECIKTLAENGIEDQEIERLMGDLFANNYFIFSGVRYGGIQSS